MIATVAPPTRVVAARAWWWRHPETPAIVAIAGCWLALGISHFMNHTHTVHEPDVWRFALVPWIAMVVAMMLPGSVPMLRRVAFNSLWRRRHRSATLFAVTYIASWTAIGGVGFVVVRGIQAATGATFTPGRLSISGFLLVAAAWQFTGTKRRCLRQCHLRTVLKPRGWEADRSIIGYGLFHARACIGSCGPMMAAMFVATHSLHLMVPLAFLTLAERFRRRPNTRVSAAALVALAGLAGLGLAV